MLVTLLLGFTICLCNVGEAANRGLRNSFPEARCYSEECVKCHCSSSSDRKKRDEPSCYYECGGSCGDIHYHSDLHCHHRVQAQWGTWGQWTSCSNTCGTGIQSRSRQCDNPPAITQFDHDCVGDRFQTQPCSTTCKIDGGWSEWKNVTICSVTCGDGVYMRNRTCTNPPPQNGGLGCFGDESRLEKCSGSSHCVVDGGWSTWKASSSCSSTCGQGALLESRTCDNPSPQNGGQACQGSSSRLTTCSLPPCPVQPSTTRSTVGAVTSSGNLNGNVVLTFTIPPFPTKQVQTSGVMHTCNKYEVIHGLGMNNHVAHTLANLCTGHTTHSSDAIVYKYCNVSHHATWNKGQNVNEACRKGISLNSYVAVSSFIGNTYDPLKDLAGVFVGCTTNGFKIATQKCGRPFEVVTIDSLTSTSVVDNPDNYYVILT